MDADVLVAGETVVDFIPRSTGPLATVEGFTRRAGGAPANLAVRLAGLGPTPLLWTRVGDDPFGDYLRETLTGHGVPGRFLVRDDGARTTLAFLARRENADRAFTFYREDAADTRFEPGRVPDAVLAAVRWVAFGGVSLSAEPARTAVLDLAKRAREAGCEVFFDPNARPELWDGGFGEALAQACTHATVVKATPGDLAAAGIEGSSDELLAAVLERGPHTAVVTLGEDGARGEATAAAPWGPGRETHAGYAVDAVDTTGAGDAFAAGLVRALADGEGFGRALAFANAAAAVATTSHGAMSAPVDRESVAALVDGGG